MRLFFKAFSCQFGIMCVMKLRTKDTEKHANKPESIMAQMAVLLSEKDDIIEQKIDVIAQQKKRIAMLEEHLRLSHAKKVFN
jgi:transposase